MLDIRIAPNNKVIRIGNYICEVNLVYDLKKR